jgi:hypothetical protein
LSAFEEPVDNIALASVELASPVRKVAVGQVEERPRRGMLSIFASPDH